MEGNTGFRKTLRVFFIYFLVPLVCAGGPVAWFSGPQWWSHLTTSLSARPSASPEEALVGVAPLESVAVDVGGTPALAADALGADVPAASVPSHPTRPRSSAGAPIHDLAEVLRFDVSPRWIVENWPRVSAALGQLQLQGYRVPLVTGIAEDDLAGALTYYFNPWQQVQRITFVGTTGDVRKLIDLLTAKFGFARRLTNDPSQFVYEARGKHGQAAGVLWIRHFPVLKASQPHERYEVTLILDRPESK